MAPVVQVVQAARECSSWVSRGNHDDAALAAYRKSLQGQDVAPKYAWVSALTADDVEFLEDLSFSLQLPDYGITIVHAGLVPQVPVAQQSLTNIYKMRDLKRNEDGSWLVLKKHAEDSVPWGQCWPGTMAPVMLCMLPSNVRPLLMLFTVRSCIAKLWSCNAAE